MEQDPHARAIVSERTLSLVSSSPEGARHTAGHLSCPVCEAYKQANMRTSAFGSLQFEEATGYWLNGRRSISDVTRRDYENCIKPLSKFFGQIILTEIHIGHVQSYQDERSKVVGPVRLNRELGVVLAGVLDRAGLWEPIARFYEPLPLPKKKRGIALEPEEEQHLWRIAAANSRWAVGYYCSLLARNTCMGTKEIRTLRLNCIDQKEYKWVRVEEFVKNDFRERTIRCNADASWALQRLAERAATMGAYLPEHYLLPHKADTGSRGANPTRPQSCFLWQWRRLRAEVAKKYPHLAKLRFYDNRHTACTRLLENPDVPYNAIEHMMGHELNSRTKRIYDHVRDVTLQRAADALGSGHCEIPEKRAVAWIERAEKKPQASTTSVPIGRAVEK